MWQAANPREAARGPGKERQEEGEKEEWTETQPWERTARAARAAESRVATRARDRRDMEGVGLSRTKTGGT